MPPYLAVMSLHNSWAILWETILGWIVSSALLKIHEHIIELFAFQASNSNSFVGFGKPFSYRKPILLLPSSALQIARSQISKLSPFSKYLVRELLGPSDGCK